MNRQLWTATALVCALAATASAQPEDSLIAVSADIVEISGSVQRDIGFSWTPFAAGIGFAEKASVSLALNPNEAQYLALAIKQGDTTVIMRGLGDAEMHPMEMASFRKLFR